MMFDIGRNVFVMRVVQSQSRVSGMRLRIVPINEVFVLLNFVAVVSDGSVNEVEPFVNTQNDIPSKMNFALKLATMRSAANDYESGGFNCCVPIFKRIDKALVFFG